MSTLWIAALINITLGCLFTRTISTSFSANARGVLSVHLLGLPLLAMITGAVFALIPRETRPYRFRFVRISFFVLLSFELFIIFGLILNIWFYFMNWPNAFSVRPVN